MGNTSSDACSLECLEYDNSSTLENKCNKYQFKKMYGGIFGKNESDSNNCPHVTWSEQDTPVENYDSHGVIYYCDDAKLSNDKSTGTCATVKQETVYAPCNSHWSNLKNIDKGVVYAEDWSDSCQDFAQKLVKDGKYKAVACYNQKAGGWMDVEKAEYAQAWPSTGYNVSAVDFSNTLACQMSDKDVVTACDLLGNLCDTQMFTKATGKGDSLKMIEAQSAPQALDTLGAVVAAIAEAL